MRTAVAFCQAVAGTLLMGPRGSLLLPDQEMSVPRPWPRHSPLGHTMCLGMCTVTIKAECICGVLTHWNLQFSIHEPCLLGVLLYPHLMVPAHPNPIP